ncbi:MAG TPA: autotransporter-associated beta strand repeat-containing protein [Verrucomicrobiae bacterium]|nr:autotransporter-associated beta strand repeat-containing protein [Verrucomicrobiae bacterium]
MNTKTIKIFLACLAVLASAACLRAGTIIKTNNTDNLNLTTSWVGGVVPGPLDTARWDSTVTNANTVALGADTVWAGISIVNPGGLVRINPGNTLTLGTNGINMSAATQYLVILSGLNLGGGAQTWNVTNGMYLIVAGTLTRPAGTALVIGSSSVAAASQGTVLASPALENGVVPWATVQSSGAATNGLATGNSFATVSGINVVAYTGATLETNAGTGFTFGGIPTGNNSTVNYDLGTTNTAGGSMTNDTYVNTLRNVGGAYSQPGTANFRANAIMNAGTGLLALFTPMQQADTTLNELVLAAWTSGITLSNVISDNVNPLHLTFYGANNQSVLLQGSNTFSGGVTLDSGALVGIRASSTPTSGTPTSGPLGTGTITMNGGTLFASGAGYAVGNPIVIGPAGGQFQYGSASPDLTINGNITGSGTVTMSGVYNVNGLFFNGDDSAFTGTVIVAGSNNRLGFTNSGSIYAKFVVNGGLAGQLVGGGTYYMGELSGSSGGGLCGHAVNTTPSYQEFSVGYLNTSSTFLGIFVDNAAGNAQTGNSDGAANNLVELTKVGTGTLTLGGNSTASGPVTINGGTLQLGTNGASGKLGVNATIVDNANLTINRSNAVVQGTDFTSRAITGSGSLTQAGSGTTTLTAANTYAGTTLVSGGTLLINGSIPGTATVMPGANLGGSGTIGGLVTVLSGGQLGAGATATSIGTLTLNSTPSLNGSVFVKINAATAQADRIVVTGGNPINYGGSLVVSNVDGPLLAGDSFTIFSAASQNGSFSSIVGSPGTGLAYSFNNGVLSVVSTGAYATNSTPTNVTATISTVGDSNDGFTNTIAIAWPSDHTGWLLQSQTNDVDGSISTNPAAWFDLPASASVNLLNITNPTDLAVYYRMRYIAPPLPASAPTGLTATPTNTAVILNWAAPNYARNFNVKSSTTSGGPYTTIANTIATTYTNTGLANGTTYYYVVSALNYYGETANSAEASATPGPIIPATPTNLTAQTASELVFLTWSSVPTATSYNVKRAPTTGGPYTTIGNPATASFSDTNVVNGTTYYYVVSALNTQFGSPVEGPNSSETNATPLNVPPQPPATLAATGQYLQVRLNWPASFGATSYNVKVATTSGGPYTTFTNTAATTVYDTGVTPGTTYYFIVTAVNGSGESANSPEANATPTSTLPLNYDFENTAAGYSVTLPALPPPGTFADIYPLPDPFYWVSDPLNMGGTASTNFSDWEHHRAEFLAEIQTYEIGTKPTVDPSMISASVTGSRTTRTLTVVVTNVVSGTNRTLTLTAAITLPGTNGIYPVCIGMNGPSGSVNASLLTAVAKVTFTINQVTTYGGKANTDPFYVLYAAPYTPAIDTVHTGQYAAWAWGCSRLIDGLYKLNGNLGGGVQLDLTRLMVTGCSYAGKMALFCGAMDERVTLTIAQESGGGGANSWRFNEFDEPVGSVEDIDNTDYGWFGNQMKNFQLTNVVFLPEDHHMLDALVAPRALFVTGNPSQVWLGSRSCYCCCRAVQQVYDTFGLDNRFGFNLDGDHAHCATTTNVDANMAAYINTYLLQSNSVNTVIRSYPASFDDPSATNSPPTFPTNYVDYAQWTSWWGTTNPVLGP